MKAELYVLKPEGQVRLDFSYEDYIRPAILWATEDPKGLAKALDVARVAAQGSYVKGLFGGEKKSGMEQYAGLVVSDLKPADGGLYIRLFNTDREYFVPLGLMKKYGVDIYKLYYVGRINPFKCSTLDVILSSIGEEELKKFIQELIRINEKTMTEGDERRLRRLSEELKAQIDVLDSNSHYVVYRGNRAFTACVPEDLGKAVAEQHAPYIECKSAEQAHFYAAVLNYMVYRAIAEGREFLRQQYSRLPLALATANLTWKDLPVQLRDEIARLSYVLSRKLTWNYRNQKRAILETAKTPEFAQIIELLDKHIENTGKQSRLEEALRLVSGSPQPGGPEG